MPLPDTVSLPVRVSKLVLELVDQQAARKHITRLSSFFTLTGPEYAVHAAIQAAARYFNDGVGSSLPMSLPFICLADEVRGKSFFAISTISSNFS